MTKKKPFLPFGIWPGNWGLRGQERLRQEAEYNLEGEALKRRKIDIEFDKDTLKHKTKVLELDIEYSRVIGYEAKVRGLELKLEPGTVPYNIALLELGIEYGKVKDDIHAEKELATLKGEPWVGTIGSEYKPGRGTDGFAFELDWNDQFVRMLEDAGYEGTEDVDLVEQWFEETSRNEHIATLMDDDLEQPEPPQPRTKTEIVTDDDGNEKKKYS